jgi:hypothetical protein
MADPISVASFALSLSKSATEALNALRERSKSTKDLDIKDQIGTLYDNVLELKEVINRLLDENKELKRQLEEQQHTPEEPELKAVGGANYYFVGDKGPYCQPCYDDKRKLVALEQPYTSETGSVSRHCLVCNNSFYEKGARRAW